MKTPDLSPSDEAVPQLDFLFRLTLLLGLVPQSITEASITASLPEMARDFGLNGEFAAQMMLGLGALGLMVGALVSGRILERAGTRRTMLGALLAFGSFGALALASHSIVTLGISRVIVGLSASCIATTCMWGVSAEYEGLARARIFGISGAISGFFAIGSVILGGFLAQHLGWRMAFVQFPLMAGAILMVSWRGVPQLLPEVTQAALKGQFARLAPLYALVLMVFAVIGMSGMQLAFLLNADGLTDAGMRSLIQGIPGVGVIFGAALYGEVHRRWGGAWALVLSQSFMTAGLALLVSTQYIPVLCVGALLQGLCIGMTMPYFYNAVSERTNTGSAQRYLGYLAASTFLGVFLSPLVFEPVKSQVGTQGLYLLCAGITAVIAAGMAWLERARATSSTPARPFLDCEREAAQQPH